MLLELIRTQCSNNMQQLDGPNTKVDNMPHNHKHAQKQLSMHQFSWGMGQILIPFAYKYSLCLYLYSDFIWDFGKLPFPTHLGKYFIKIGKIRAKIHEIGKIKAIFGLGMTPIYGLKNGQIKSLLYYEFDRFCKYCP